MTDELATKRLEREKTALAMIRASFESAQARGDAAFYLRPDTGWLLLEMAERAHNSHASSAK